MKIKACGVAAATALFCLTLGGGADAGGKEDALRATRGAQLRPLPARLGLQLARHGESPPPVSASATKMVLLHGICGEPSNSCAVFAPLTSGSLVCARADLECPAGGAMWSGGRGALERIERAMENAEGDGAGPRMLIGFSQGAYVALRAAKASPQRFVSLLLIGAFVAPTRAELETAGVVRLGLAAGDHDAAAATMRETAKTLQAAGYAATFTSLGRVGHSYVGDDPQKLARAVRWTGDGTLEGS